MPKGRRAGEGWGLPFLYRDFSRLAALLSALIFPAGLNAAAGLLYARDRIIHYSAGAAS